MDVDWWETSTGEWQDPLISEDLEVLDEIEQRRGVIAAVEPSDLQEEAQRRELLAILDHMDRELQVAGRDAPGVVEGWERLAPFESFGCVANGSAGCVGAPDVGALFLLGYPTTRSGPSRESLVQSCSPLPPPGLRRLLACAGCRLVAS